MIGPEARATAAAAAGLVAASSYVLQRLGAAAFDPAPALSILAQAHVPFSWRVFAALLHGAFAAALVAVLPEPTAARLGRLLVPAVPLVAFALAALSLAKP